MKKVSKISAGDSNTICLEFCTNDEERLVTTLNVALERARIPIVGGTVFGYPEGYTPKVLVNGEYFFRGDNNVVLQNLPAYMVSKVNVYRKSPVF